MLRLCPVKRTRERDGGEEGRERERGKEMERQGKREVRLATGD